MDFDRYGRLHPTPIIDIFQDIATVHAERMGIGRDAMVEQGVFWAVVRSKLEVVKAPSQLQVVTVRTWPNAPTRFSFVRNFTMCDERGDVLVKAMNEWVLMGLESRAFISVKDHYDGPDDFDEARAFEGKLRKIADFSEGSQPVVEIVPRYSDIDVNGHVNNAVYIDWAIDSIPDDLYDAGDPKELRITYKKECRRGDRVMDICRRSGNKIFSTFVDADDPEKIFCIVYSDWN
jgi:acyl-ACP thioesterase